MQTTDMKEAELCLFGTLKKAFSFIFIFSIVFSLSGQTERKAQPLELMGNEASKVIPGTFYLKKSPETPYPSFARFNPSSEIAFNAFFPWLRKTVKSNEALAFKLLKKEKDELGMEHYRFVQTYQNIPIDNTTYLVHVKSGKVVSFNGYAIDITENLSPRTALTESQALDKAMLHIGSAKYKWQDEFWISNIKERTKNPAATYFPKGEMMWYKGFGNTIRLAYRFDIHSASPDKFERIFVDAITGEKLAIQRLESNCSSASVNTIFNGNQTVFTEKYTDDDFRLRDDCQSAEIWIRDWNSATTTPSAIEIDNTTNTWTTFDERFGATVLWETKRSYAYFLNVHGRNSYDNANGDVEGYINAVFSCSSCPGGVTVNNASMSFSGGFMKVGLGSSGTLLNSYAALDVIGHEYAHAVTGSTAGLDYNAEPGALNESFSDIFGESIENWVNGSNDWLMAGERTPANPIRSMSNPKDRGQPDTYLGTNWVTISPPCDGSNDECGVHTNSGVQNFWFYLLSVGGTGTNDNGDDYEVSAIGLAKARDISYRNLTVYLGEFSEYDDARSGAINAAIDLYGGCSNEVKQVTNAWYAVGVGSAAFDAEAVVTSDYNGRDVSCHDECDGSANVIVTSGIVPTFDWSHGPTTQSVSGLCPGNYSVTVTNFFGIGCSVTRNVTIQNTPELTVDVDMTSDYNGFGVSCYGEDDGSALAKPAGGTTPYSYLWSDGQTTNSATGLSAGNYSVTVTDANGCTVNGNVNITQPPLLEATAAATSNYNGYNISCFGGSDGVAEAYPTGGVEPYSYLWSDGQTTKSASGLSAQNYVVQVTDANGCVTSANVTLTEPPKLTLDAGQNEIVYWGYPDSACTDLTYSGQGGGVPPYTIQWSTGSTDVTINVCPTSTTVYYVTITDANNCVLTDSVKVCVIDVRCGAHLDKVTLCHPTGSQANPYNTLCVALTAAKIHIGHGDQLAACGTVKVCNFPPSPDEFARMNNNSGSSLLDASPNPFSRQTNIRFNLAEASDVSLRILDNTGREISTLFTGEIIADNSYEVKFDGSKYPAGMYFIVLRTSSGEQFTKKLLLAK